MSSPGLSAISGDRSSGWRSTWDCGSIAIPITDSTHAAPRAGVTLALTRDRRTMLKAGVGLFYDRVPLNIPAFPELPARTVLTLGPQGEVLGSTAYTNMHLWERFEIRAAPPGMSSWIGRCSRKLAVRIAYQNGTTQR